MQLAISQIGFAKADEPAVYARMRRCGFAGLEGAPTRLAGESDPYSHTDAALAAKREAGFCIPSLQSIWYGQTGSLFCAADAPRLAVYTARAAAFAVTLGCPSLVLGCPKQRVMAPGQTARDALPFFARIAADAFAKGTAVSLEANPPVYGTNFCNTSAEAFAFAREVEHLYVNYDVGTLLTNGESLTPLADYLALVRHIHLSEPGLAPIERRAVHKELAALLRAGGYAGFVSVEMRAQPLTVVERVLEYTAEVFA